jgi:hypothetical protein
MAEAGCLYHTSWIIDDQPWPINVRGGQKFIYVPYTGQTNDAGMLAWNSAISCRDPRRNHQGHCGDRHYYLRQLRDAKISAIVEGFDLDLMQRYAGLCAWALAQAHARSGDAAMIAGYMGASETFDDAIGEFAMEYADQNESDYRGFVTAAKEGRIAVTW